MQKFRCVGRGCGGPARKRKHHCAICIGIDDGHDLRQIVSQALEAGTKLRQLRSAAGRGTFILLGMNLVYGAAAFFLLVAPGVYGQSANEKPVPDASVLDKLKPGWARGVVRVILRKLHTDTNTPPIPDWLS